MRTGDEVTWRDEEDKSFHEREALLRSTTPTESHSAAMTSDDASKYNGRDKTFEQHETSVKGAGHAGPHDATVSSVETQSEKAWERVGNNRAFGKSEENAVTAEIYSAAVSSLEEAAWEKRYYTAVGKHFEDMARTLELIHRPGGLTHTVMTASSGMLEESVARQLGLRSHKSLSIDPTASINPSPRPFYHLTCIRHAISVHYHLRPVSTFPYLHVRWQNTPNTTTSRPSIEHGYLCREEECGIRAHEARRMNSSMTLDEQRHQETADGASQSNTREGGQECREPEKREIASETDERGLP